MAAIFTNNLSGATCSPSMSADNWKSGTNVTFSPNSGYTFEGGTIPYIRYGYNSGSLYSKTATANGDGTYTLTIPTTFPTSSDYRVTLYGTAIAKTGTALSVSTSIKNAVLSGLPDEVTTASVLSLTITANEGYKITSATIEDDMGDTPYSFDVSSDGKTATLSNFDCSVFDGYEGIYISAKVSSEPKVTISNSLTNCSTNVADGSISTSTELAITLTANTGYEFTSTPTISYNDVNGNYVTENFTISSDKSTATLDFGLISDKTDSGETLYVEGGATAKAATTYNVTGTLENCTSDAPTSVNEGDSLTITLTANNGYNFTSAPKATMNGTEYSFTIASDLLTATLTISSVTGDVAITGSATEIVVPSYAIDKTGLINSTSDSADTISEGSSATITITANEGYTLSSDDSKRPRIIFTNSDGDYISEYFTISEDLKTATYTLSASGETLANEDGYQLLCTAEKSSSYEDRYGSINIYKVSVATMQAFAKTRFQKSESSSGEITYTDLGDYIVKLFRLYADIGDTFNSAINVGYTTLGLTGDVPYNDTITLDMGSIEIPLHNNSKADYQSELSLLLPFIGEVAINSNLCGKTISLKYVINLVMGDALAVLTCNEIEVAHWQCTPITKLLYLTKVNNNRMGDTDLFNAKQLYGFTAYLVCKWYQDTNESTLNSDSRRLALNEVTGMIRVNNVDMLCTGMTSNEVADIKSKLASGVIL